MEPINPSIDIESRRMELRGVVQLAGEVIAQYWPMRTFVHHNPLHSLEYLPFEETARRGKQFMGGHSYLPGTLYREYLKIWPDPAGPSRRRLEAARPGSVGHDRLAPDPARRRAASLSHRRTLCAAQRSRWMINCTIPRKP